MLTKIELRKKAKETRKSLDMEKISERVVAKIKSSDIYKNAQHVMLFYPLTNEINLLPLLKDNKNFYLPKIEGEDMLVCPYKIGDEMAISSFKTKEPLSTPVNPEILDIIFIPALMVDKSFHRLGYGKGFYDRFLSKNGLNATKIVPIPHELIVEEIPSNEQDQKFNVTIDDIS